MKIMNVRFYEYSLPLKEDLYVRSKKITQRQGLIIQMIDASGHEGFGDIAPLENLHKETYQECVEECRVLREGFPGNDLPDKANQLEGSLEEYFKDFEFKPSIRFGIEMALLNLISSIKNTPLYDILPKATNNFVHLNGLLYGDTQSILEQAQYGLIQGIHSFKLKASDNLDQDITNVNELTKLFSGKVLLHIDVNQKWDLNTALKFVEKVGVCSIEYIEEPFKNLDDIEKFNDETTIPVALDESLECNTVKDFSHITGVDICVLKPNQIGGIERTWKEIVACESMAIRPVISSCYESGLGMHALASLGCNLAHEAYVGLDTLKFFKKDILKNPFPIENGKIKLKDRIITHNDIDFSLCTELC